jgi:hypothetical protein
MLVGLKEVFLAALLDVKMDKPLVDRKDSEMEKWKVDLLVTF